jgi:sialate O-acetylesterase
MVQSWDKQVADFPEAQKAYETALEEWQKAAEQAKASGAQEPPKPDAPRGPDHPWRAAGLYNAMIAPLVPYAIQGAVWYQGESNAGRAYQYRKLFPVMIQDWRNAWGQGPFSFYFVQLANFTEVLPEPDESNWAELREAQTMTLKLKNTGMAVIIDIGEAKDIHPKNKQDVGKRLALNALAKDYGKKVTWSGPLYKSMRIADDKVILRFAHTDGGLAVRGGDALKGFAIAGKDRKFVWADAEIKGNTVVVSSPQVLKPAAVRYAWANNPVCNLVNGTGLPASPFRTDQWPGQTRNSK